MNETTKFTEAECDRAWQHALHEENVFNDRLNFFLLAEAMLLVFYAEVIGKIGESGLMAIGGLGLFTTGLWVLINMRQIMDLRSAKTKLHSCMPDYEPDGSWFRKAAAPVLGYVVPLSVAVIWIALLLVDKSVPVAPGIVR